MSIMTRSSWLWLASCALLSYASYESAYALSADRVPPSLPRQFQADLLIVSHLTNPQQHYPHSRREIRIQYDYDQGIARADMLKGYEVGKTYVRRYDQKCEYMVKQGKYRKCERAYLGDVMPTPEIPFEQQFIGVEMVRGKPCEHWVHSYATTRVHIYADERSKVPLRLTEEVMVANEPTLMLTYDLRNVRLGPQNITNFQVPGGYTHKECTRNVDGFPYIHAFHYYLRF
ncbi:hypothetical protein Poli38472_003713 [Pythium oligandrum]|uniref:Uncharacterized protein n=1 Tax=Pythium oligandrum TaxID=41045 RepID=A0A8K1CPC6_PYTOL|nr:hypothetical protein Poli38472_003713 [Pythium oligandrum]|eukprot:TMW65948.1 hypothetical protein Poli38472_003713 [Pythium oligandrum]